IFRVGKAYLLYRTAKAFAGTNTRLDCVSYFRVQPVPKIFSRNTDSNPANGRIKAFDDVFGGAIRRRLVERIRAADDIQQPRRCSYGSRERTDLIQRRGKRG